MFLSQSQLSAADVYPLPPRQAHTVSHNRPKVTARSLRLRYDPLGRR